MFVDFIIRICVVYIGEETNSRSMINLNTASRIFVKF